MLSIGPRRWPQARWLPRGAYDPTLALALIGSPTDSGKISSRTHRVAGVIAIPAQPFGTNTRSTVRKPGWLEPTDDLATTTMTTVIDRRRFAIHASRSVPKLITDCGRPPSQRVRSRSGGLRPGRPAYSVTLPG